VICVAFPPPHQRVGSPAETRSVELLDIINVVASNAAAEVVTFSVEVIGRERIVSVGERLPTVS
jgi:hypothetical protein